MSFRSTRLLRVIVLILCTALRGSGAVTPEFAEAQNWLAQLHADGRPPFSFLYEGKSSATLLPTWQVRHAERELDPQRKEYTLIYTEKKTGLEIRCVALLYRDYPSVEWTVYFKNNGTADTPVISEIRALDARWQASSDKKLRLHHAFGTFQPIAPRDFMPQETILEPGKTETFIPFKGRASGGVMPYFNLERGDGSGMIIVVGWPGAWAATFSREEENGIHIRAGQELTHLRLRPGEEIRTPLIALQFWRGDWIDAQNTFRRWMLAHNLPKPGGRPPQPQLMATSSAQFHEMTYADEASQLHFIDRYREEKIPIDAWWMDAGWYEITKSWEDVVSWRVDRKRFPRGLRPITDHARHLGLKNVVWFEPERVRPTSELVKEHPEWLLANHITQRTSQLLNLGNSEARRWITDLVSQRITEEGIEIYRQDFTLLEPVEIWRSNDADDRQGITENHHITGYLAFWEELLRRHPGLIIDNCAAGGSRLDLESLRRSLPFFRSDYIFDVVSNQSQTYGLSLWIPYFGTGTGPKQFSPYELRSNFSCPLVITTWDLREQALPYDDLRRTVEDWRSYAGYYTADFYPLTPCSLDAETWIAWQFHHPETGRGVVQAFRRDASVEDTTHVTLRGLAPSTRYRLTDLDDATALREFTGRELMTTGLDLIIAAQPGAIVLTYEKLP